MISSYDETLFYSEDDFNILCRDHCNEKLFNQKTIELVKCVEYFTGIKILDIQIYNKETSTDRKSLLIKKYLKQINKLSSNEDKEKFRNKIKKCEETIKLNILTDEEKEKKKRTDDLVLSEFAINNNPIIRNKLLNFLDDKHLCVERCVNPNHNHSINNDKSDDEDECIMNDCYTCICTQPKCKGLWVILHKKTNISFAVGNECIHRFSKQLGDENEKFEKYYNAERCSKCQIQLFYDNKNMLYGTQNTCDSFVDDDKNPYCFSCYKFRYINTPEVLKSFKDENDINEIINYKKHVNKCKNCKVAMYFKTTSNHIANSSILNKDICKLCIEKEQKIELKQQGKNIKECFEKQEEIKEHTNRKIMINNAIRQYEKLKEVQRLDNIIQFKKDRIIRKRGFFNKDYNYTAQCKKCDAIYDYFKSENNNCLCLSCFKK